MYLSALLEKLYIKIIGVKLADQLTNARDPYLWRAKELTAASNPLRFGVKAEYETPGIFFIPSITCLWSAIFGMERKQTIKQEYNITGLLTLD